MKLARLHHLAHLEPYWQVHLAILVAIGLQLGLSNKLSVGPKDLIAASEALLLLALTVFGYKRHKAIQHLRRSLAIVLIALVSAANMVSLILVIKELFKGHHITGSELIISALAIYLTNIIIFGIWYWELDDNTPNEHGEKKKEVDFLFPQMSAQDVFPAFVHWNPTFTDYLYVSLTNASAFSPTDTMPLTHRAKMLMSAQSTVSLITVVLVIARAANILG
jgi:uncharacterized membrane protein